MRLERHRTLLVNAALVIAVIAAVAVLAFAYVGWGPMPTPK